MGKSIFKVIYDGYGEVTMGDNSLVYYPKIATSPDETHACLVLLKETIGKKYKRFSLKFKGEVVEQLRQGSSPNTWETMWIIFNYKGDGGENESGTYFVHKTNGTEMGQFVNLDQTYLATNDKIPCVIGQFYDYEIIKTETSYEFKINGKSVIKHTNNKIKPTGSIGFYCEDAKISLSNIQFKGEL